MVAPLRAAWPAASILRPLCPSSHISNRDTAIRISSNSSNHNRFQISNRDTIGLFLLVTNHSPLATEFLIANPRLEFLLTAIRIKQVQIPNRKFFAFSRFESSPAPLASNPQNTYTGPSAEGESPWKPPSF
jgi:hypothetical protein